ncbi:hypothetical protein MPLB_300008 [Mesorhizobium sp. ORS 3324]|nr:hypothetical protein MPLB_300008 [Mesorhizobium sp. ORS 3324]
MGRGTLVLQRRRSFAPPSVLLDISPTRGEIGSFARGAPHSRLLQKLRLQHQALHLLGVAFDLAGIAVEADVLHQRAALDGLGRALDLEVLDQGHGVAILQRRAVAVFYDHVCHGGSFIG